MTRKILLSLCTLPFCLLALSSEYADDKARLLRIRAESATEARSWLTFCKRADEESLRLLGLPRDTPVKLQIRLYANSGGNDLSNPYRLQFSPKNNYLEIAHLAARSILQRRFFAETKKKDSSPPSLDWLAAGIVSRILLGTPRPDGRNEPDYEPLRRCFHERRYPSLALLLTHPVSPEVPTNYQLYALHCDLLCRILRPDAPLEKPLIRQILDMETAGRTTLDACRFLLADKFEPGETLQDWYERRAESASRYGRRRGNLDEILSRIEDLTTIRSVSAGGRNRGRIPIEEIPKRLKDFRLDKKSLSRIQNALFELAKDAPPLLREPIMNYYNAFGLLIKEKRSFKKQLIHARKTMDEAVKKQRAISRLLDDVVSQTSRPEETILPYVDIVRRGEQRLRALDPELQNLLDRATNFGEKK